MNDDEAFCQLRAHAGYVYPDLFVDYYIRNTSYQLLPLKDFHIEILNAIKPGVYGKQINVQAPRSTGKTTLVNGLIPLWRICYKHFDLAMDRQPEEFILIVGRTEPMACQRITEIRQVLERNPLIRQDFGDLVGDVWAKKETDTKNGIALRPLGRGSSPRGALIGDVRPTLKLCDDIEDPKRCLNPKLREEDRDWFMTDFMYAGDLGSKHSNTIIVDTVKHPRIPFRTPPRPPRLADAALPSRPLSQRHLPPHRRTPLETVGTRLQRHHPQRRRTRRERECVLRENIKMRCPAA